MSQVSMFDSPFQEQVKAFRMAEVEINYKHESSYSDMVKISCSTDCLKANACSLVFAHNHPSGNINPSESDIKLTNKLKDAGNALDIQVLDHLILTSDEYYSFADEGLL